MTNLVEQTLLNRYQVLELVGRGGMAEVYKVWDRERSVHLAMKVLHEELAIDRVFMRRFQREAQTLAKLQHPNIVRFYGFEQQSDLAFMLLDYVEGRSLKRVIFDQAGPLPFGRVMTISQQVLSALGYAHNKGFVHADIKPGNILIDGQGTAYVTDFGIARMTDAATMTMAGAGTPAYMAPEAIRGAAPAPAVDQYGWGVVLFEMLTGGERPFTGEQATMTGTVGEKVRWEHLNLAPPAMSKWNPAVTPELEAVVGRCLAKDPEERFPGVQELLTALADVQDGLPQDLQSETDHSMTVDDFAEQAAQPPSRPRKRKMGLWVALAAVACAVLGLGYLSLNSGRIALQEEATQTARVQETENALATETARPTATSTTTSTPTVTPTATSTPIPNLSLMRISEADGMELIYIPAGSFQMGREEGNDDESPVHEVTLDEYWIDRTEVTNAMFAAFLNIEGNRIEGGVEWLDTGNAEVFIRYENGKWVGIRGHEEHPVNFVTWYGAQAYCDWAGRRLPTEAEWEHAARSEDGRIYPWGNDSPNCALANYCGCESDTSEVGMHPAGASPYGVDDMAGNVWEWVADRYGAYGQLPQVNPTGPFYGSSRVIRGGGWGQSSSRVRTTFRDMDNPDGAYSGTGFRCALGTSP